MRRTNNRSLYESIMRDVSKIVKRRLNEAAIKHASYVPNDKKELIKIIRLLFEDGQYDLNCIDVSNISDFLGLFAIGVLKIDTSKINFDVSDWDVSRGTNFAGMFYECESFKGAGLSNWDVSNGTDFHNMFLYCKSFNCDLSNWDVYNGENFDCMFMGCKNFNCYLCDWDIDEYDNYSDMLNGCLKFEPRNINSSLIKKSGLKD